MNPLPAGPNAAREFVELSRAECLRMIATGSVGRVVFTERALPAVHPVNYLLDGDEVVFRTRGGGKLAAATLRNIVGFHIDHLDAHAETGWSVLGVGEAHAITDLARLGTLSPRMPRPWAASAVDGRLIVIPLHRLTGRLLGETGWADS